MGLRASDPAGHHGWGGRWRRCGRRPGFRGDPPYLARGAGPVSGGGEELRKFAQIPNPQLPHCRLHPGDRSCRAWEERRKGVAVLHREARPIARDVAEIREATAGCAAILQEFCDGSVGYLALEAPPWQEAGEGTGRALQVLEEGGAPGRKAVGAERTPTGTPKDHLQGTPHERRASLAAHGVQGPGPGAITTHHTCGSPARAGAPGPWATPPSGSGSPTPRGPRPGTGWPRATWRRFSSSGRWDGTAGRPGTPSSRRKDSRSWNWRCLAPAR